jgi:hypothetical protein
MEPTIVLGLPGLWKSRSDIVAAIAHNCDQLMFAGMIVRDLQSQQSYQLDIYEHDPLLARAFAAAGRDMLTDEEIALIAEHTFCLYLVGPGGSIEQARTLAQVGARLLATGALAVKVESAGVAHSAEDWRSLAMSDDLTALYYAYVTKINNGEQLYSCGMHLLGLPDAAVPGWINEDEASELLDTFLLYMLLDRPTLGNGHTFGLTTRPERYRLRHKPCMRYHIDDLFFNPYGFWVLEA